MKEKKYVSDIGHKIYSQNPRDRVTTSVKSPTPYVTSTHITCGEHAINKEKHRERE